MRTLLAFVAVAAVLMTIGTVVAAVALAAPSKDLFLPPRVKGICDDAFVLRADGGVAWLTLEGGMWEFAADGRLYDLSGVERFLPADLVAFLQDHPGTHLLVSLEGVAEPCLATFHMRGVVVRVTALEV